VQNAVGLPEKMAPNTKEILEHALGDEASLFSDDYSKFLDDRTGRLVAFAKTLCS
jgi:hypothetical protein